MVPASNKPDALVENTVFLGVSLDDSTIVPAECRIAHGLKALHGFGKVKYLRLVPWRMTPSAAASDATRENDDLAGGEAGSVRAGPGSLGSGTFHIPVVETDLVAPGCVAISQAVRRMVAVEAFSRVRLMEPKQNPLSNFKLIVRKLVTCRNSAAF
ncbi:hypothetical protein BC830DRAFT_566951 [Chytriomyces sp. MP71]|nr:hypothetical protein BC830DRAFT_566951 [Chytriomyces sp. MP71]